MTSGNKDQKGAIASMFQITEVSRPLWSIGKLLDNQTDPDSEVVFKQGEAVARDSKGRVFAKAVRKGGLYVMQMQLKNPKSQPFQRQD